MKKTIRFLLKTAMWLLAAIFVYVVSLFFRQERIPGEWVERAFSGVLPTNLVFHCDGASFGFRHGLHVRGVKLYDLSSRRALEPVAAAADVSFRLFERELRIVEAKVPRLHDGYYEAGSYAEPLGDRDLGFALPDFQDDFTLVLERPSILGVSPERVAAQIVSRPDRLDLEAFHLDWRDSDRRTGLDGFCSLDLGARRVRGVARGLATQAQIRPLIEVLDVPSVLEYMDAFTGVTAPVPAGCAWDVDLRTNEFKVDIELHPVLGRYNGVPMSRADGRISLHVTFPGDHMDYETTIGPLAAADKRGRQLDGTLRIVGVGDRVDLELDAHSALVKKDLLDVIGYLNGGELDFVECDDAPQVAVLGRLATEVSRQADNDLKGDFSFRRGALFGVRLQDVSGDFSYVGDVFAVTNCSARGKKSGSVAGSARISMPGLDPAKMTFSARLAYSGGSLEEVGDFFKFDIGDRSGEVEGEMWLEGPLGDSFKSGLCGGGRLKAANGHLAQMRLFMGLTELLAKEVPGIDRIVNQSEASCTYTVENGVVRTRDVLIEGSLFSISAEGSYDIPKDELDFVVRVKLMKNESTLGRYLIRPITWPFSKLLMEYRVRGSLEEPRWEYISVLDRML